MNEQEFDINAIKLKLKNGIYYILTAILSATAIIVFPLLDNSNISFKDAFPTTPEGWTFWIIERTLIIFMNIMILKNFVLQAKKNIANHPNYIEANEILKKNTPRNYKPKSPSSYLSKIFITKGSSLIITSSASLIAIGEATINYNYLLLLATIVTLVFSISFGIISMKNTEAYWTGEYLDYAKEVRENNNKITKKEVNECLKSITKNLETYKNK